MSVRVRELLLSLALVVAGGALALAVEHAIIYHHHSHRSGSASHAELMREMSDELQLTPAQRESANAIFTRHQAAVDMAWRSVHGELRLALDSVHTEIARILTPEQNTRFHAWVRGHHQK